MAKHITALMEHATVVGAMKLPVRGTQTNHKKTALKKLWWAVETLDIPPSTLSISLCPSAVRFSISELQKRQTRNDLIRLIVQSRVSHWRRYRDTVIREVAQNTPLQNGFYRRMALAVGTILGIQITPKSTTLSVMFPNRAILGTVFDIPQSRGYSFIGRWRGGSYALANPLSSFI